MSKSESGDYFKVRLRTNAFELEVESSDRTFIEEKLEAFRARFEGNAQEGSAQVREASSAIKGGKALSLAEFVQQVRATSGTECVVAVGYFLEKYQGQPAFTAADIKNGFLRIKYQHSNPSDAIAKARAAGRLMEGSDKNTYVVTQSGEAWISERLAG